MSSIMSIKTLSLGNKNWSILIGRLFEVIFYNKPNRNILSRMETLTEFLKILQKYSKFSVYVGGL